MEQDPERMALTELRREYGRDIDAWPAEHRHRYRVWEGGQLVRKAGQARADAAVHLARAVDLEALAAIAGEQARAAAEGMPEPVLPDPPDEPAKPRRVRRG